MGNTESSIRASLQNKPTVLIVGGGFAGIVVAQHLEKHFNVIVIDRKNYFFLNIAALRASVDEKFAKGVAIPYSHALKFGHVVQAEVESISKDGVRVKGKAELIKFDYLVIATGTSYAFPGKVASPEAKDVPKQYSDTHAAVERSKNIVLIGGGVVGVELLGELTHKYPDKKYTLIHAHDKLIPGPFNPQLQENFLKLIKDTPNVELILNDRAELDDSAKGQSRCLEGQRTIKTSKGKEVKADLVFFCTGAKVNNASFGKNFPLDEAGRIKVNKSLQVEGHQNIFAVGDCANFPELKTAYVAGLQAADVAKNIVALSEKKDLKERKPLNPAIFVPFGPKKGYSQFPSNSGGSVVGPFLTSMIKGKNLFVSNYWGLLHQKPSADLVFEAGELDKEKVKRFSSVLRMDEGEIKKLMEGLPAELVDADHT